MEESPIRNNIGDSDPGETKAGYDAYRFLWSLTKWPQWCFERVGVVQRGYEKLPWRKNLRLSKNFYWSCLPHFITFSHHFSSFPSQFLWSVISRPSERWPTKAAKFMKFMTAFGPDFPFPWSFSAETDIRGREERRKFEVLVYEIVPSSVSILSQQTSHPKIIKNPSGYDLYPQSKFTLEE